MVRKGESEPPSNYDLTHHDTVKMDQTMKRTLPFKRTFVDRKKMMKNIEGVTKGLKAPVTRLKPGDK
jgi:hypothetical protein